MTDNGRESSGRCVNHWVAQAQDLGIGEILLTSIDQEGTAAGYDLELVASVAEITTAPVLASGGFANSEDALRVIQAGAQASVIAQALHYDKLTITQIKQDLLMNNIAVRQSELNTNIVEA
jgi:cyclase